MLGIVPKKTSHLYKAGNKFGLAYVSQILSDLSVQENFIKDHVLLYFEQQGF